VRDDGQIDAGLQDSSGTTSNVDSEVKDDLNRKAEEYEPLPPLVTNAYYLLGKHWLETVKVWEEKKFKTRPVMIT